MVTQERVEQERSTYDVKDVARLAGVHVTTIYDGVSAGTVPGVIRLGRRLLFARAAVDGWLAGQR